MPETSNEALATIVFVCIIAVGLCFYIVHLLDLRRKSEQALSSIWPTLTPLQQMHAQDVYEGLRNDVLGESK